MANVIKLQEHNVEEFKVNISCLLNDAMRKALENILKSKLEKEELLVFGVSRQVAEAKWVDIAIVEYTEEVEEHLHITFIYGVKDITNPPSSVPKPARLEKIIRLCERPLYVACEACFLYEEETKSSIEFPITVFRTDNAQFNEITGIAVSRTQPNERKYDIQILRRKDGSLMHWVHFDFECESKINFARISLNRALEVSKQFIQ